jgi:hypothetical protein
MKLYLKIWFFTKKHPENWLLVQKENNKEMHLFLSIYEFKKVLISWFQVLFLSIFWTNYDFLSIFKKKKSVALPLVKQCCCCFFSHFDEFFRVALKQKYGFFKFWLVAPIFGILKILKKKIRRVKIEIRELGDFFNQFWCFWAWIILKLNFEPIFKVLKLQIPVKKNLL